MYSREEKLRKLAQRHHLADDEAATIEDILDASRTYEPSGMVLDAELELAASELRHLRAEVAQLCAAQQLWQPVVAAAIRLADWQRCNGPLQAHLDAAAVPAAVILEEMQLACRAYLEQHQQMPPWRMPAPSS
jgi:hypothetical protein